MDLTDGGLFSFPGIYIILTARCPPKAGSGAKPSASRISTRKTATELYKSTCYTLLHT